MELSEDRGIECQGVCFDFIDGKIVLSVYQNLPGIKRHLAGTTFLKAFTIDDWKAVNGYLMDAVGDDEDIEESERRDDLSVHKVNNIPKMSAIVGSEEENKEEEGDDGEE